MNSDLEKLQIGLTPKQRLYQIVEHGMCIGCGFCQSIAGEGQVQMQLVASGYERPVVLKELGLAEIETILPVCPGTNVEGLPEALIDPQTKHDLVWGAWRELYYAYSAEPAVRHLASTGGLLTALSLYLIESKTVDFILHAKASSSTPSFGEATISRSRDDVIKASGSRYGPTATLKDIIRVLDDADLTGERFAFIGTPCDVTTLRSFAKLDPRVNKLCDVMLTMVCGGFMSPLAQKTFIEARGVKYEHIQNMRYRGNGSPGPTSIEMRDGQIHEFSYLDFWGKDDAAWQLPARCKVCPDGIGDSADIAASDTWDGGAPTVEGANTDLGFNAAIVRTRKGVELMRMAVEAGYITRGQDLSTEAMNRFQPHQEAKKRSVWARFEGMRSAGNIVPNTSGLRIRRLSALNSDAENERQTRGTRDRVRQGGFKEPPPTLR